MCILPKALAEGDIHIKVINFVYCLTIQLIFIILFASILSAINLFTWIKTSEEQKKEQNKMALHTQVQGKKLYITLQGNIQFIALQGDIQFYCPAGQHTDLLPDHVICLGQ